jgi:Leucine-rich repeat (LRR) protein
MSSSNNDRNFPILAGVFPSTVVNLTSLRSLRLNNNRVIGTIPPGVLMSLAVLASFSRFSRQIITEFWQLPNLEKVTLSNTALTIRFPPNVSQTLIDMYAAFSLVPSSRT